MKIVKNYRFIRLAGYKIKSGAYYFICIKNVFSFNGNLVQRRGKKKKIDLFPNGCIGNLKRDIVK